MYYIILHRSIISYHFPSVFLILLFVCYWNIFLMLIFRIKL